MAKDLENDAVEPSRDDSERLSDPESAEALNGEENGDEQTRRVRTPSDEMFHVLHEDRRIARVCVKELFSDKAELLDLESLVIEASDFYSETLKKRIADLIYTIKMRDSSEVLKLTLILEHKGQSSSSENQLTLAKILSYLAEYCYRESRETKEKAINPGAQPIPVIIYTGPDENLTELEWRRTFRVPPGFEEFALTLPIKFVNMTRLRLEGRLPKEPFLATTYDIMTRHSAKEYDGFARTALTPLRRVKRDLTDQDQFLVRTILNFFREHARSLDVKLVKEDVDALLKSGNLERDMVKDAFYEYFAPIAQAAGKEEGIEIGKVEGIEIGKVEGIEIGKVEGKEEMKNSILGSQRAAVRATVESRFGSVPVPLNLAVDRAQSIDSLVDMRVYALTQANSLDDLVAYAQNVGM